MELKDRVRKVDISKLSPDQADNLSAQIGEKVRGICDEAAEKANAILNIYGMSAKIAIKIEGKVPKKRAKKNTNLKGQETP